MAVTGESKGEEERKKSPTDRKRRKSFGFPRGPGSRLRVELRRREGLGEGSPS